jgi:glycosyltransferase involved in cell wall biosynthesis
MRVLHVNAGNLYGGIENLLVTLARLRHLCPEMEPQFALCFEGRLSGELRDAGAAVHLLGAVRVSRPWTVWLARRRLGRLLERVRPDVVVCHGCWPHALFAKVARRRRLPLVFWAHGLLAGRHWLERWAGRVRPDLVLANSRATEATLANLFPGVRSEVLYLPVPAPDLPDREAVRRRVRAELGTPEHAAVIIQVSRLEPLKGHRLLLEALAGLREVPGWECWIVGGAQRPAERTYRAELLHEADRLALDGRVRFLGERADVPRLLAAADVYCQPNTGPESFGISFVEAMYAGLPVVTTAMGGAVEILDETCGLLVSPADVQGLSGSLARLLQEPGVRLRLGKSAPARARHLCDPETQMDLLGQLLGRRTCREVVASVP